MNDRTSSPDRPAGHRTWYRRPGGLAAAVVVIGSFILWGYALSGVARRDPPDTLADKAYAAQAETVCAPYRQAVDALPPAPAAKSPVDRAEVLGQANDTLAAMVADLRTIGPDNDTDRAIVDAWLRDWDHYLQDRRVYRDQLATGADAKFILTSDSGVIYTKSMDNLATVNAMPSCATPGDV